MARLRTWGLRLGAGLLVAAAGLYLLRWPLLGGLVRGRVETAVRDTLKGELREAELSGSLLFGAEARDVRIEGGPDSPLLELRARRVVADYGFLGSGRPDVRLEGVTALFADREPQKPSDPLKNLRTAEKIVRTLRFTGRATLVEGVAVLPDGLRITVAEGRLDGDDVQARGRIPGFGDIEASRRGEVLEATATEGPVRRARVEGGRRFSARIDGHDVEATGTIEYGPDDTLLRAEADATAALGRARVSADFLTGRVEARGEIVVDIDDPVRAKVSVSGHVAGPLFGPLRAWKVDEAVARAGRVAWRNLELEEARVDVPDATFDALTWRASARRGGDRFEGEGTLKGGRVEGEARATLESSAPYYPDLPAKDVVIRGRFRADGGFFFAGRIETGPGRFWTSLAGDVSVTPDAVEVPALLVKGLPHFPEALVSGTVDLHPARIRASARAGESWASFEGTLEDGRFAADVDGLQGRGRIAKDGAAVRLSVEPGEVRGIRHGTMDVRIAEGRATLEETLVEGLEASGRLSGSVAWTGDLVSGDLRLRSILFRGAAFGTAAARFRREKDVDIDALWAVEGGVGAELKGRWGAANDLRLRARVPDLSTPWARRFVAGLRGSLSVDARIGGSAERPEVEGGLSLAGIAVENAAPFSLEIPLRSEGRRIALALPATPTPYGRLTFDARIPLPGAEEPLEGRGRLDSDTLPVFAPFLPEALRPYVPAGELRVEGSIRGREWSAAAALSAPILRPPEPFAPVKDLQATATIDRSGLKVDKIWGRMGGATFEASLRRDSAGATRGTLRGTELLAVSTRLSHIRVSPNVDFLWEPGQRARLTGALTVPLALIHEEPGSPGSGGGGGGELAVGGLRLRPARGGGVLVPGLPGMEEVALDLEVATTGEVRVENSVVGAMLRAKGRLRGTLAEPGASGEVEATSGEVKLPAAIFVRIETARVTIPPEAGADPSVHFVGRVGKGEGSIEIRVDGPLARPELNLSSDPPATQQDLMARLAFGHPPGQVEGAALGAFALRLFEQYTAGWPQARPSENVLSRLKPTVLNETGEDPVRRPWELPSGRTARGMVVRTEYLWSPHFSVVGEADREANVGGDIKLRLRFR